MKHTNKYLLIFLILTNTIFLNNCSKSENKTTEQPTTQIQESASQKTNSNSDANKNMSDTMDQTQTGKIIGTIKFDGEIPILKTIQMSADPICVANNEGKEVTAQTLVLGPEKTVANILVQIKSGLQKGKTYETPTESVVLDQIGCMYLPHIIALMKNQELDILNSDGTLHNVHGLPKVNDEFNVAMPKFKKKMTKKFEQAEDPFRVKCDVHPWMGGYMAVMDNPYFSVTKEDGQFEIKGLPAGDYEIEIWHEKLGIQTAKLTLADGETKVQDFTLTAPEKMALNAIVIIR